MLTLIEFSAKVLDLAEMPGEYTLRKKLCTLEVVHYW